MRERDGRLVGASLGAGFTDLIGMGRLAGVASEIDVGTIVRRCYD